jgi:hypothetical protein
MYREDISSLLEEKFDLFQSNRSLSEHNTPPIIRFVDDRPQVYIIKFSSGSLHSQTNASTGYTRTIDRILFEDAPGAGVLRWEFHNDLGVWELYDSSEQLYLDSCYQSYLRGQSSSMITVSFPGRPERYSLDFSKGFQTNTVSQKCRSFRRA